MIIEKEGEQINEMNTKESSLKKEYKKIEE